MTVKVSTGCEKPVANPFSRTPVDSSTAQPWHSARGKWRRPATFDCYEMWSYGTNRFWLRTGVPLTV